jgi:phosphoribosyl-ATP pyrophosphohydrolase/phosphoribosyl-AMP cyclohydrolase
MNIDFSKHNGLVPVIIQHSLNRSVLMLGYMNEDALKKTQEDRRVTFFSRSRNCLWTKGETSGNFLKVNKILFDCDMDAILITVLPAGPVCHTGSHSCFNVETSKGFLYELEQTLSDKIDNDQEGSYSNQLFKMGINKIAQKVGEEAIELVIEAKDDNEELFKNEAADLLYHLLVLLKAKKVNLSDIEKVLYSRSR